MSSAKSKFILAAQTNRDALENYFHSYTHYIENHTAWLMRQKMKRLRSLFRLFETHVQTGKKLKKNFDIVFDTLGKYRDANQMLVFIENHLIEEVDKGFILQLLQNEIAETGTSLTQLLKSPLPFDFINYLDKYISKINKVQGKCFKNLEHPYIKQRYKKIRSFIKREKHLENETLHRCRILLKQIINIMKVSGDTFKTDKVLLKLKDLEHIDKELGTWHDLDVMLMHFRTLEQKFDDTVQNAHFHSFITSVEREERQHYTKALAAMDLLIS